MCASNAKWRAYLGVQHAHVDRLLPGFREAGVSHAQSTFTSFTYTPLHGVSRLNFKQYRVLRTYGLRYTAWMDSYTAGAFLWHAGHGLEHCALPTSMSGIPFYHNRSKSSILRQTCRRLSWFLRPSCANNKYHSFECSDGIERCQADCMREGLT
jgi:hypothetical protein